MTRRRMLAVVAAAARPVESKTSQGLPLVLTLGPLPSRASKRYRIRAIPPPPNPVFPPEGTAYRDNPESHHLWRTIHAFGVSVVVDPVGLPGLAKSLEGKASVASSLPESTPELSPLARIQASQLARSPHELAEQLGTTYGHVLSDVTYIQALSCIARIRIGQVKEIEELAGPFVDGRRDSLAKPDSTLLAGHLLFAALYERTRNRAYLERVLAAANLGFAADGSPHTSMPYHNEMSDSVFMGCPILGEAARLTGDPRYTAMAVRHLRFMEALCLRPDGLYRHSPLCDAAWGRGNAFPALGMALLLETQPEPDPHVLQSFRSLLRTLRRYQDADGLWHQIIDRPDSWAEFSATAMIATAALKGVRAGWLKRAEYQATVQQAWSAIQSRAAADGTVLDVCESTGKQPSTESYLNREAIWGKDPRGGAMAMSLAVEMMQTPEKA